jgi:hypothetical protein
MVPRRIWGSRTIISIEHEDDIMEEEARARRWVDGERIRRGSRTLPLRWRQTHSTCTYRGTPDENQQAGQVFGSWRAKKKDLERWSALLENA